ncbi:MAG TPA: hypothetical protein VIU13_13820 [Chryseolinea sp.]
MLAKKEEANPKLEETLLTAQPQDVLEADEMCSFIYEGWIKCSLWTVMYHQICQIAAYVVGDRSGAIFPPKPLGTNPE